MSLDGWASIIDRMGKQSQERENTELAKMKRDLPGKITALRHLPHEALVTNLRHFAGWGHHDPRKMEVMKVYVDAIEAELLRRLG